MEPISTSFVTDSRELLASCHAAHRKLVVFAVGLALVMVVGAVSSGDPVPGALGLGYLLFVEWIFWRSSRAFLVGDRTAHVEITVDEYCVRGPDRSMSIRWTGIRKVQRIGRFWVVRVGPFGAGALPVRALDGGQATAFEQHLRGLGLLR